MSRFPQHQSPFLLRCQKLPLLFPKDLSHLYLNFLMFPQYDPDSVLLSDHLDLLRFHSAASLFLLLIYSPEFSAFLLLLPGSSRFGHGRCYRSDQTTSHWQEPPEKCKCQTPTTFWPDVQYCGFPKSNFQQTTRTPPE